MTIEAEFPAVYLDNVIEDLATTIVGKTPTLINLDPEAGESLVPKTTNVHLEIATTATSGTIDLSATRVYLNGILAFDAGTFQAGFNGGSSAYSNPQADVLRVVIDPTTDFVSESTVLVRVVSKAVADIGVLDTTYPFNIADTTAPQIVSATAVDLNRVRLVFTENVNQLATSGAASALFASDWTLARLGDYIDPVVSANVVSVEPGSGLNTVDLITDVSLTPGGAYRVSGTGMQDLNGVPTTAPNNTFDFLGWQPPAPSGRSFDLYKKIPQINRTEDQTLDLYRFVACLQEVADLLLYDIDRFVEILDPDTAPEDFVDEMLADLGNPFDFDLALADKRRLAQILVAMYQLKGTGPGIINVIRFFLGLEVTVDAFNDSSGSWTLGDSNLGDESFLSTPDPHSLYSFTVSSMIGLTTTQRTQLRAIVEYMKPAHTHFVALLEPVPPLILDHMELGLSELGESWTLH